MRPCAWPVPGKNGPGVSSATPPGSGSGAAQPAVRAPVLARVPAWAAVAAGAGVPGVVQAVRARALAGAPAVAGVPAAPAMAGTAATAAAPGAAAAVRAAVAGAGPAAAPPVRGAPVPAIPASAGWDRRVRRPRAPRERGSDLLPPWDSSRLGASYPRSGRVRAGGVHAGQGCPVLRATTAWASAARCPSQTSGAARLVAAYRARTSTSSWPSRADAAHRNGTPRGAETGRRGLRAPGTALPAAPLERVTETWARPWRAGTFASREATRGQVRDK